MRSFTLLSLGGLLTVIASGCGSSSDGLGTTFVFSCDVTTGSGSGTSHTCTEYDSLPTGEQQTAQAACMGTSGTGCSMTGVLGSCSLSPVSNGGLEALSTLYYYQGGTLTASVAQTSCTQSGGSWNG